jgi:hypothetical protein
VSTRMLMLKKKKNFERRILNLTNERTWKQQ